MYHAQMNIWVLVSTDEAPESLRMLAQLKRRQGDVDKTCELLSTVTNDERVIDKELASIYPTGRWSWKKKVSTHKPSPFSRKEFSIENDVRTLRLIIEAARRLDDDERRCRHWILVLRFSKAMNVFKR